MSKRSILHIAHAEMLTTQSIKDWIKKFENKTRTSPTEIVLPGVVYQGPTFDSKVYNFHPKLKQGNLLPDWVRQIRQAVGNDIPIWGTIIPEYGFLGVETVMLQDQYGTRFYQACITNPTIQKITDTFIAEMAEFGLAGIAFDLTDIYPNSGSNSIIGIQNSCFCNHCIKQLEVGGWHERQRPFIGRDNITRFVLHLTETGADHIEPFYYWLRDTDTDGLLQLSEARGFITEKERSVEQAEELLHYLLIRGQVTASSARKLGHIASENKLKVAIILGDAEYDMSQSTNLDLLIQSEAANEYWVPAVDAEYVQSKGALVVQYLMGRSTYVLNSLFDHIGGADMIIATSGIQLFVSRLTGFTNSVMRSNQLNPASMLAVDYSDEYSGAIGVPLDQNDIVRYIEGLTGGTLGQVVPRNIIDQIIDQVRLASPGKS